MFSWLKYMVENVNKLQTHGIQCFLDKNYYNNIFKSGRYHKLTWVVVTEILSLATVLFALGAQIGVYWAFLTWLQNEAEDLFACPQSHGLMDIRKMFRAGRKQQVSKNSRCGIPSWWPDGGERSWLFHLCPLGLMQLSDRLLICQRRCPSVSRDRPLRGREMLES